MITVPYPKDIIRAWWSGGQRAWVGGREAWSTKPTKPWIWVEQRTRLMTTLPKAEAEGEPHPGKNNEKEEKLYNRDRKKRKSIISSKLKKQSHPPWHKCKSPG